MSALSASSLWRVAACPASVVLPQVRKAYADAEAGTRAHAALEATPPPGSFPEVAYAYDVLTERAREVGRSIGRNYGELADSEIPGTADLVTVQPDHVLVEDWKSGIGYRVSPPASNLQLMHNGMCAALVQGKPRAIVQIVYLKSGEVLDAEWDIFDFPAIKARLRDIWTRVQQARAAWAEGPKALVATDLIADGEWQCWRCPAVKACPLKTNKRRSA